jgi:N-acetylglucosamine malate deacetylase 2
MSAVVCIFAHPDDEAFGPGGTIALLAEKNNVYLICITNGDAGKDSSKETRDLGEVRREELQRSAKILGIKKVILLSYKDGSLNNNLYHEIADKLVKYLSKLKPDTLLTFEPSGISGHIDHIAVSMITSFVFEKLTFVKKLMYYCISKESRALEDPYFIYFPPGYAKEEINETYEVSSVWDKKITSMMEHKTQKHDADRIISKLKKLPKEEYFLVKEKHG